MLGGWAGLELLKFSVGAKFSSQSEYSSHAAAGGTSPDPAEAAPPQQGEVCQVQVTRCAGAGSLHTGTLLITPSLMPSPAPPSSLG